MLSPGTLLGGMLDPGSGAMRVKPWYLVGRKFGPWYLVRWRLEPGTWRGGRVGRPDPGTWLDGRLDLVPGAVEVEP